MTLILFGWFSLRHEWESWHEKVKVESVSVRQVFVDETRLLQNLAVLFGVRLDDTIHLRLNLTSFNRIQQSFGHQAHQLVLNSFHFPDFDHVLLLTVDKLKHETLLSLTQRLRQTSNTNLFDLRFKFLFFEDELTEWLVRHHIESVAFESLLRVSFNLAGCVVDNWVHHKFGFLIVYKVILT